MRRLTVLCLAALCLLPLLSACGPAAPFGGDGADLSYADHAFSAAVRGTVCRTSPDGYTGDPSLIGEGRTDVPWTVAASVTVTAPDASGARTITVAYTEPASLCGLTVTREIVPAASGDTAPAGADAPTPNGVSVTDTLTLGSISVTDTEGLYTRLLLPALLLLPAGDVTDVARDADGRRTVTVTDADAGTVTYTFLPGSSLPVRVARDGDGLRVDLSVTAK